MMEQHKHNIICHIICLVGVQVAQLSSTIHMVQPCRKMCQAYRRKDYTITQARYSHQQPLSIVVGFINSGIERHIT